MLRWERYLIKVQIADATPTIGDRLKEIHHQSGLVQRAFAERCGLGQNMVVRAEKGKDIRLSTLHKMAVVADLDVMLIPRQIVPVVQGHLRAHVSGSLMDEDKSEITRATDEPLSQQKS